MKLLHCLACGDILALRSQERSCECRQSTGRYTDHIHAEYRGPSRVLGMLNREIARSVHDTHVPFEGPHYRWFVISEGGNIGRTDGEAGWAAVDQVLRAPKAREAERRSDVAQFQVNRPLPKGETHG